MKMLKRTGRWLLIATGIALLVKGTTTAYFRVFGSPTTKAPKSFKGAWQSVKQTFPEMASDMDSPDIIKERQKDIT